MRHFKAAQLPTRVSSKPAFLTTSSSCVAVSVCPSWVISFSSCDLRDYNGCAACPCGDGPGLQAHDAVVTGYPPDDPRGLLHGSVPEFQREARAASGLCKTPRFRSTKPIPGRLTRSNALAAGSRLNYLLFIIPQLEPFQSLDVLRVI